MSGTTRVLALAVLALLLIVPSGFGAPDIDRSAVDFKTPAEIKWVRNAAGTNEQAVLFGDPGKPGPYVVRLKWLPGNMSRPHFHPNDRFFVVISGTWWMGTGEKFDPDSTVPAPAGSYVIVPSPDNDGLALVGPAPTIDVLAGQDLAVPAPIRGRVVGDDEAAHRPAPRGRRAQTGAATRAAAAGRRHSGRAAR